MRTVRISNSALNKFGFRMLTAGAKLDQFQKNPLLLFMHFRPWRGTKDEILPIGRIENVRVEGDDILGELVFDQTDEFAKKIEAKWDAGIYKMVSVGADPVEISDDPIYLLPGQTRSTVTKWVLDEVSVVDRGGNDDAIALYNSTTKEFITLDDKSNLDFIPLINKSETKPEKNMKLVAIQLGLKEDATEAEVLAALKVRDEEHAGLQTSLKAQSDAAIKLSVETAVREKRISDSQKDHFIALGAKVGLETLNLTLAAIEPAVKPNDIIKLGGNGSQIELKDKKWGDLTHQERITLRDSDRPNYIKLYKAEYGIEPKLEAEKASK